MGMPTTIHNLNAFECISALQKFIRRGMEVEAMEMAAELGHTSRGFATWVCNRLQIISHEDVGLAAPAVIPLVRCCCEQAKELWAEEHKGDWRMVVGTAIRALCRAPKSREGDHFHTSVGLRMELEGKVPEIPEWVHDKHSRRGKAMGRGVQYFLDVSTQLVPAPAEKDPYQDEAARLWLLEESQGGRKKAAGKGKALDEPSLFTKQGIDWK